LPIQHPELIGLALSALEQSNPCPPLRRDNLPAEVNSFVGREQESDHLLALLTNARLLTLTGPGGIGKTRLGLHLASRARGEYADGVWLAEFGPLNNGTLVVHAVASVLGVKTGAAGATRERLRVLIRDRHLLLLFDNCEHLIDACAELAESMLRVSPGLRILATSREPLRVPGEVRWPVPPLSVPESEIGAFERLESAEAVRLFVDRARAIHAGFELSDKAMPVVAQICRRLDGIPLAIELAATHVAVSSLDQIVASLDDRFVVLRGGSRTAPAPGDDPRLRIGVSRGQRHGRASSFAACCLPSRAGRTRRTGRGAGPAASSLAART